MNYPVTLLLLAIIALTSCQRIPGTTYKQKVYDDGQYREVDDYYRYRPNKVFTNRHYNYNDGNDGSYRPEYSGQYTPVKYIDSQIQSRPKTVVTYTKSSGLNDGRYIHDNSGSYKGNDGRYTHDDSGAYRHETEKTFRVPATDSSGLIVTKTVTKNSLPIVPSTLTSSKVITGSSTTAGVAPKIIVKSAPEPIVKTLVRGGGVRDASQYYDNKHYAILRMENEHDLDGYNYAYETENGITAQEEGKVENFGSDDEVLRTRGFYSYIGPDGVQYTVHYTADENGFVAHGDHLPKAPVLPETYRAQSFKRV